MRVSAALITAVLPVVVLNGAWGASACPQAATATPSAQCAKRVKAIAKAPAAAAVTAEPIPAAESWHGTLDPLAAGGWVLITDGPIDNPSVVYASTHNVLHNGNVVTAWVRWEYSRIQAEIYPLHYQSAVTHEELDCDARTYRRAAVFYYRRNNLQDKALQFTALNDDTTWKLAIPGSEGDAMLNWACTPPAVAHHAVAETKAKAVDKQASDKADAKTADTKSGSAAAAASSAPAAAPAAAGGGINLHTNR
jgi:hypothetical protein